MGIRITSKYTQRTGGFVVWREKRGVYKYNYTIVYCRKAVSILKLPFRLRLFITHGVTWTE